MSQRILVVDDELDLREILQFNLENAGFVVDTAASAEEALEVLTPQHQLILLDVMMGGMSGFELAKKLRQECNNSTPIIFLTAKDKEDDLLRGFSVGGDDYISKPFSLQEVLARVRAVLRRVRDVAPTAENPAEHHDIYVDYAKKLVYVGGEEVHLSRKEFGILCMLLEHPTQVFSREEILDYVWQGESCVLGRTVDVHITRLRKKLGDIGLRIVNRQGYGYCYQE